MAVAVGAVLEVLWLLYLLRHRVSVTNSNMLLGLSMAGVLMTTRD